MFKFVLFNNHPVVCARVAQWQRNRLVIGRLVGSIPLSGWANRTRAGAIRGGVPEWLIGAVCKTAVLTGFAGSNPALSTISVYEIDITSQNLYNAISV